MNFTQLKQLALNYADRSDTDVSDEMENFAVLVTNRLNRKLKTMGASTTGTTPATGADAYTLPADFGGFRQISHVYNGTYTPMTYVTPEKFEDIRTPPTGLAIDPNNNDTYYYTIADDDNLYVYPKVSVGNFVYKYYLHAEPISSTVATNWVSEDHPDVYLKGLVMEIKAYVKNEKGRIEWEGQFERSIEEIKVEDKDIRWSGDTLQMRTE